MLTKSQAKSTWVKRRGLNPDDFETAWTAYCNSTNCEWCKKGYKSNRDKQMDHCHDFHNFRNILCKNCNGWRRDSKCIYNILNKKLNKYYYHIRVRRDGKYILLNTRRTLEEAEELLLDFKKNNDFYFPFWANENWHLLEE